MNKQELRRIISQRRASMSEAEILQKSADLMEQFLQLPQYRNADSVYGYLSFRQEIRTLPILEQAQKDGKRVAVPKCFGHEMRFIWLDDLMQIVPGYRGIPEPIADLPIADDKNALVLVPGLAFDHQGHRLGYGGGFYDRFLAAEPEHPTVALCYDFQLFDRLETEEFDIPVDLVLRA